MFNFLKAAASRSAASRAASRNMLGRRASTGAKIMQDIQNLKAPEPMFKSWSPKKGILDNYKDFVNDFSKEMRNAPGRKFQEYMYNERQLSFMAPKFQFSGNDYINNFPTWFDIETSYEKEMRYIGEYLQDMHEYLDAKNYYLEGVNKFHGYYTKGKSRSAAAVSYAWLTDQNNMRDIFKTQAEAFDYFHREQRDIFFNGDIWDGTVVDDNGEKSMDPNYIDFQEKRNELNRLGYKNILDLMYWNRPQIEM